MTAAAERPLADLDELVELLEVAGGPAVGGAGADTLLDECRLDSLGWVLVGVLLADHGGPLADDDWADLSTVGDLWSCYTFRLANPAP